MLTKRQIAYVQELISKIEQGKTGEGELRIEIKNRHPRRVWITFAGVMPEPDDGHDADWTPKPEHPA